MELVLRDVTPDDGKSLAHVLITANEEVFRGRVPDECLEFSEEESATNWTLFLEQGGLPKEDFMVVAETAQGEVVGYTWGGPNIKEAEYGGELRQISILPDYQRKGIGRRLVCHVAEQLAKQAIHSLRVEVLKVNPHREFYARLGGTFINEFPYDWDGVILPACVYAWADTSTLLKEHCDDTNDV